MRIVIIKEPEAILCPVTQLIKEQILQQGFKYIEMNKLSDLKERDISDKTVISITIQESSVLRRKFWYKIRLAFLLKRIQATTVIYTNGCCTLNVKLPQCMIVPEYSYLKGPKKGLKPWQQYSRRQFKLFADKAKQIVSFSFVAKQFIVENYFTNPEKIAVVYPIPEPEFGPLDFETKASILDKYTDGKGYFIVTDFDSSDDLIELLKAFSKFKKWQQSGMKLMILARNTDMEASFLEKMANYKYRADVIIIQEISMEKHAQLLASAYALLHFTQRDENIIPVLNSMQAGVPVISTRLRTVEEICGNAAIYFEDKDVADLSKQMIRLYKEEHFCTRLVEMGKLQLEKLLEHNKQNPVYGLLVQH